MRLGKHFSQDGPDALGFEAFVARGARPRANYIYDKHFFVPIRVGVVDTGRLSARVAQLPPTVVGIDQWVWDRLRALLADPLEIYETRGGRLVVALRRFAFCVVWGRSTILEGHNIDADLEFAKKIDDIAFAFYKPELITLARAVLMGDPHDDSVAGLRRVRAVSRGCVKALRLLRKAGVLRELRRCVRDAAGIDREVLRLAVRGGSPWDTVLVRDAAYELAFQHRNLLLRIERETPGLLPLVFFAVEAGEIKGLDLGAVGAVKRALRAKGISEKVWRTIAKSKTNPFQTGVSEGIFEENWYAAVDYLRYLEICDFDKKISYELRRAIASRDEPSRVFHPLWWSVRGAWPFVRVGIEEYWRRRPEDRKRFIAEEFLLVTDWVQTEYPQLDSNQYRAGWRWMLKRARHWAECVKVTKRCSDLQWHSPIQKVEHDDLIAVALDTPLALWEEAQVLRHCAAIYDEKCVTGKWLVFSIRNREGDRLATVSVKRGCEADRWGLEAVRQFANSEAQERFKKFAEHIVRLLATDQTAIEADAGNQRFVEGRLNDQYRQEQV